MQRSFPYIQKKDSIFCYTPAWKAGGYIVIVNSVRLYVCPSVCYALGYQSLIRNSFHTTEWNLMKLLQNLYYILPLCTSYFTFWSDIFWVFSWQNMDTAIYTHMGGGGYHLVSSSLTGPLVIPPAWKAGGYIVIVNSVRPSVRPSVCYALGYPSLIRNSSHTTEWNLMQLSQNLYYMLPLCTSYFTFWSDTYFGFPGHRKTWTFSPVITIWEARVSFSELIAHSTSS